MTPALPDLDLEISLWANGVLWIAGIDEAGRGALAGPVAAAAVILPRMRSIPPELRGVRDSKKMTPAQREAAALQIREIAVTSGVGFASAAEIDRIGILPATRLAARRAINALEVVPDHLLLDFIHLPEVPLPQTAIPKGDSRSLSIAAASVLAKTARDARLRAMDARYPGYGFADHKGYGTAAHRAAIRELGPAPIHRLTFAPLRMTIED